MGRPQRTLRGTIEERYKSIFKKYMKEFEKEVMKDIKRDFEDSIDEWTKGFVQWKESKGQNGSNKFDIIKAAGSLYGNSHKIDIKPFGDYGFTSTMFVDPEYMDEHHVVLTSDWGDASGNIFPNEDAFNLMYMSGIYGYDLDIVKRSWYKNESPQKREQIIYTLSKLWNVIPPDPFATPDSIMNEKFKTIQSKEYLDKKWKKYDKDLKRDFKKKV